MMTAAIIGAGGQLGSDLAKALAEWRPILLTHADLDICNGEQVRLKLQEIKPQIVINTAAYNRVDDAETGIQRCFEVNTYALRHLAQACADLDCVLAHISTDYVFGGEKQAPYTEVDAPNPLSVYGLAKLAGEYFVRNLCPKHFVVRTSGLYGVAGSRSKGGNFVETMLRLAHEGRPIRVVPDQVLTPTYTGDLAQAILALIQTENYGLYHITNGGECSWYTFADKVFELCGMRPDMAPISTAAYGARAPRPAYSVLAHERLKQVGVAALRPWPDALAAYLKERGKR